MKDWNEAHRDGVNARDAGDRAWRKPSPTRLVVTRAADIKPEKVKWLWQDRLPLGKCVLLAGYGGVSKSMLLQWIAATVSRGGEWPCGEGMAPVGSVIVLSAEDDAADTIIPRLMAAEADRNRVHILTAVCEEDRKGHRSFNLQADLAELERKIAEIGDVLLIIIDPITSYVGAVDDHKNANLRSVLEPLGAMAARQGVTVIGNTHFSKAVGGNAASRVIGSVAYINHARAAFILIEDPEDKDRRLFLPCKSNIGRPREGLVYHIAQRAIPGEEGVIWAPFVEWESRTTLTADQAVAAMAGAVEVKGAGEEAEDFLLELLAVGPMPQKQIKGAAHGAGIAWRTVERAKARLGVEARRESTGEHPKWVWRLPATAKAADPHGKTATQDNGGLGGLGGLDGQQRTQPHTSEPDEGETGNTANTANTANSESGGLHNNDGGDDLPEMPDFLRRVN